MLEFDEFLAIVREDGWKLGKHREADTNLIFRKKPLAHGVAHNVIVWHCERYPHVRIVIDYSTYFYHREGQHTGDEVLLVDSPDTLRTALDRCRKIEKEWHDKARAHD